MKKITPIFSALFACIFTLGLTANAGWVTLQLREKDLARMETFNLNLPDGFHVLTPDITDSPVFDEIPDLREVVEEMSDYDTVAIALSEDFNEQIYVTVTETSFDDFMSLNQTELANLAGDDEIVDTGKAMFIKTTDYDGDEETTSFSYTTVNDGNVISLVWVCFKGAPTSEKTVIESMDFSASDGGTSSDSFVYTETDSGLSFTVPAGWRTVSDRRTEDVSRTEFAPDGRNTVSILYSCHDVYGSLGKDEQEKISREKYTKDADVLKEFDRIYGSKDKKADFLTVSGDYYARIKLTEESDSSIGDLGFAFNDTYMYSFSDGRLHVFRFRELPGSDYYSDFSRLLETVDYPTATVNIGSSGSNVPQGQQQALPPVQGQQPGQPPMGGMMPPPPPPNGYDPYGMPPPPQPPIQQKTDKGSDLTPILLAVAVVVAVILILLIILLFKKKKEQPMMIPNIPVQGMPPYPDSQMPYPDSQIPPMQDQAQSNASLFKIRSNMQNNPNMVFCTKCGEPVNLADSKICPKCGTKNKPVKKKPAEED